MASDSRSVDEESTFHRQRGERMSERREKAHFMVEIALTLSTILILSMFPYTSHYWASAATGAVIDIYTEKTPFDGKGANQSSDAFEPQELVVLHALATYNGGPQCNMLVAFQANGPLNAFQNISVVGVATTDESGIGTFSFRIPWPCANAEETVFGRWIAIATVNIAGQVAVDTVTFQVGWIIRITELATLSSQLKPQSLFSREDLIVFNMTVENIALTDKLAVIKVDVEDARKNPIIHVEMDKMAFPPGKSNVQASSQIPLSAESGLANVSAAPFTAPPESGGRLYSPAIFTTFTVAEKDIAITGIELSTNSIFQGGTLGIAVTMLNKGNESETFDLSVYYDSAPIEIRRIIELPPLAQVIFNFTWNTDSIIPGSYRISASAPLAGDANPSDNTFVDGIVEIKSGKPPENIHDVAVLDVAPYPTVVEAGQIVNINVTVKNTGLAVESFYVTAYYDHAQIDRKYVANLAPSAETQLLFTWNTSGVFPLKYVISAAAEMSEPDPSPEDNTFVDGTVTILPYPPFFPTVDSLIISIIIVIAAIAGIILLFLLLAAEGTRRRRKRPVYTIIAHPHI
jgi:hypothetical protein